ncbi:MAG: 4-hydroxythreonine-4-phosphate dehydrogenase PdxA [Syntrophorhabdaceae bacterium]|nr:4-hydroxythreonine-4-phosphate dehydrogenase PdxA [Syntrophorhabdaceae bacterium]
MDRIAVTMGDPAGIGAEIILSSLSRLALRSIPVVIGDITVLDALWARLPSLPRPSFAAAGRGAFGDVEFIDLGLIDTVVPGRSNGSCGRASYGYIEEALKRVFTGDVSAIVTCPIAKSSLRLGGIPFPGHTELLAHAAGVDSYIMMLANPRIRVSLVTIHIPLATVPAQITEEKVFRSIATTSLSLQQRFSINRPAIKVCGLNPHAGEQGLIGHEEDGITRAILRAQGMGMDVSGPYPADSLFHNIDCDAYIAMYHDQGLIPVKTIDFRKTVNITLGLPFVRTSPGHGTGFDIAGKGVADPASLIEAYRTAETMTGKE